MDAVLRDLLLGRHGYDYPDRGRSDGRGELAPRVSKGGVVVSHTGHISTGVTLMVREVGSDT